MGTTEKFIKGLLPFFFDGLTELVFIIKNINKLSSVKTPSKLRQNSKLMTEIDILKPNFTKVLTDYKTMIINVLQNISVKTRQAVFYF